MGGGDAGVFCEYVNQGASTDIRGIIMTPVQGSVRHPCPPSVDDLAREQVLLEILSASCVRSNRESVRREDKERLKQPGDHPLAPAMGIINGLRLSVLLWGVILLGVMLIW